MTIPCLRTGGAEWAFIRQANALADAGHEITCYVPYRCNSEPAMFAAFDSLVTVKSLPWITPLLHRVLYKLSLMFPQIDPEQRLHTCVMQRLHREQGFDAINPHLRAGATMACAAFEHTPVRIVESDHGDYQLLLQQDPDCKQPQHALLMRRIDAVVCPSQANVKRVQQMPWQRPIVFPVIPYAMDLPAPTTRDPAAPFTFGMVARGIAEKGWAEAVKAYRLVRAQSDQPTRLILVGDGAEVRRLSAECQPESDIHFKGLQSNTAEWIAQFDVGLLPSYFIGESLPCAVIECLAQGKPVVATNVGGLREMIEPTTGRCGVLIPLGTDGRADVEALANAMRQMMSDAEHKRLSDAARTASLRYAAPAVAQAYINALAA